EGLEPEIAEHIGALETKAGKRFGDADDPLMVSVRSGAAVSMPGMMDTILNLGLNDDAVAGLAKTTGNGRFARDSYRRLIQMYGEVVDGVEGHRFEQALTDLKAARGAKQDVDLSADDLAELIETFKRVYAEETGNPFPQDARAQLAKAVRAVFDSWDSPRAQVYRRTYEIPDDLGTAVNVVQMVFGNRGDSSGTGVCFTRDPSTGESRVYGEFLQNAQGEDVVAGIRTPEPIERMGELLPDAYQQLLETIRRLEEHYRDMQDIEFTVEEGTLFLLQTRTAKRTAPAALRAAVEMVEEGLISKEEAVARIDPAQLDQLLHPMIDPAAEVEVVAKGLNASPGAASGAIVFDADTAERRGKAGESVILVRWETTPDDFHGMLEAAGILTAHGGLTSHAAVVARGMGTPCITGCEALQVDLQAKKARLPGHELGEGDTITIDGGTGEVIVGAVALVPPQINEDFSAILEWADGIRSLKVRTNADTPEDAAKAREFGAEGIGLCRTEHMFADAERLDLVREMILASDEEGRRAALDRLLPIQQSDFEGIFEAMAGLPVTIRLLDWPLHEFLPALEDEQDERMRERILSLHESNPMLGWRACRLGLSFPEIYEMQVRAIARAAIGVGQRTGRAPLVEVMIPLVGFGEELRRLRELTVGVAREEGDFEYLVGTMIELPRACVRADEIAEHADFFSFGTNDLTQSALGISRDDGGRFLANYLETGVLEHDPFETIDQAGVGDLMQIAVERGRRTREDIKLGICGEHGGEPKSVAFCHRLGLDYVSCSPYRVPLARLAAAQAVLAEQGLSAIAVGG
ncbi:MAG: pyruvate, orthophosphate dikinase, partial [Gaiellaceae bacterium]|nr:pyruvate, orthophosphate dikinase [Gaiellaceae bacterium]